MFKAPTEYHIVENVDNCYKIAYFDEVKISPTEWKKVAEISVGDSIYTNDNEYITVVKIIKSNNNYYLYS